VTGTAHCSIYEMRESGCLPEFVFGTGSGDAARSRWLQGLMGVGRWAEVELWASGRPAPEHPKLWGEILCAGVNGYL